jgi:5-methylthioadenosine/S-adenosylhomocysteine deaminase
MAAALRIDGLTMLTMAGPDANPSGRRRGSLRIRGGRIEAIGELADEEGETRVDGQGLVAIPGFVQGHVHSCQTLFRGLADDLPLMPWLESRIWPLEAALDAASARASARLTLADLLRGGTTCVQVMESVRHAEQAMTELQALGMTAIVGNCLMDQAGPTVPKGLPTSASEALRLCAELHKSFHRPAQGLHYAVTPRFVLACSEELAREAVAFAKAHELRIHTHACEHEEEVELVRKSFGDDYILVLSRQGMLGPRTSLAHCVHTTKAEREALETSGTAVLHCPSANLKLGSGIAPIADYDRRGIRIALGADGAPCNNRLSALTEIRQAALLQCVDAGPGAWSAERALHAATLGGAKALGLDAELGSLAPGKRADLVLFDLGGLEPGGDEVSKLVWSADERHIRHVLLGGRFVVRDGAPLAFDAGEVAAVAAEQRRKLLARAGISAEHA